MLEVILLQGTFIRSRTSHSGTTDPHTTAKLYMSCLLTWPQDGAIQVLTLSRVALSLVQYKRGDCPVTCDLLILNIWRSPPLWIWTDRRWRIGSASLPDTFTVVASSHQHTSHSPLICVNVICVVTSNARISLNDYHAVVKLFVCEISSSPTHNNTRMCASATGLKPCVIVLTNYCQETDQTWSVVTHPSLNLNLNFVCIMSSGII